MVLRMKSKSTTSSSLSATGVDKERGTNRSTFSVMRCCSAFSGAYTPINVLNVYLRRNKRRQSLKSGNIKRNTSISFISMKFNTRTSTRLPLPETTARAHSRLLCARINAALEEANGWLPFDRYMEYALYTPDFGYYCSGAHPFGHCARNGSDFITAPELSPLFARPLACAIGAALDASNTCEVMEFGAGSGLLAAQLLDALGAQCARYTIVELSGGLRARQQATLAERAQRFASRVRWLGTLPDAFEGVIVGNEVLDAMPIRLFARRENQWFERGVTRDQPLFRWLDRPVYLDQWPHDLMELLYSIDGHQDYLAEFHQAARAWTRNVCAMLARGAALLLDYGFPRREYYHPQRSQGTLMCHYRHHAHPDPFFWPGLQDITAHVDFSGIADAALATGAELLGYTSQARFLINSGIADALAELDPLEPARFLPAANTVHKLLSEAEMGELYKVIGFGRGIDQSALDFAFATGDRSQCL